MVTTQEGLAKFGYKSERKVGKFKNPTIFWQLAQTYCINTAISGNKISSGDFGIFFSQKSFV
jgi:hypothetical protein